ncbi:hypothetical protein PVL30_000095 [Lodderomyces elongisporus]|uniref:uncharacterized protein n=1 Tax=Lodderomyces elongisporus TaxID=36914 RepID=UPI002926BD3F|nr:uncharacterized protein PVL30_000095 [Lodderomyces elongisporus]WLF76393.1 hypothetical protein PVL30_000095 [Lodderomyces elongisporus]
MPDYSAYDVADLDVPSSVHSSHDLSLPSIPTYTDAADGTLVIMIVRAKHLPNRRKLDKQSPYVIVRLGVEAKKTKADFRAGQTPEWTHEVRFQLTRERKPILKVDILDETNGDPTPIGNCEIDASIVFRHPDSTTKGKHIYDNWYDLTCAGKRAGMVYLEMTFYASAPVLPPKIPSQEHVYNHKQHSYRGGHELGNEYGNGKGSGNGRYGDENMNGSFEIDSDVHFAHPETHAPITNDVFVSSENSQTSKRSSLFSKTNQLFKLPTAGDGSVSSHDRDDEVVINVTGPGDGRKSPTKFGAKFSKLKNKLNVKQWGSEPQHLSAFMNNGIKRDLSPISAYGSSDIDKLEEEMSSGRHEYGNRTPYADCNFQQVNLASHGDDDANAVAAYADAADNNMKYRSPSPLSPPPPPQHSISPAKSMHSISSTKPLPKPPVSRKPPPSSASLPSMPNFDHKDSTAIPFSADSVGLDDESDSLPTKVFMLNEQVKSLSTSANQFSSPERISKDEIDPKYYAPTPSEHFSQSGNRFANGIDKRDLEIDKRTKKTGYIGNGMFSPSVFQKASGVNGVTRIGGSNGNGNGNIYNQNNVNSNLYKYRPKNIYDESDDDDDDYIQKPAVPPKIPKGLTEKEYFALEKEKYLRDLQGRRA